MVRKAIYRAFPELDSFSDERCVRFVQAAKRPWGVRARMFAASTVSFLASAALLGVAISLLVRLAPSLRRADPFLLNSGWNVFGLLALLAVCGALGLVAKDMVLRRRLRHVLRTRGRCHSCRYLLIGVSVSPTHEVLCPECGFVSCVDPSLGELATDEAGRTHYEPSQASLHEGPRWLTLKRRGAIRRWGVRIAIAAPVLLLASAGGYYVFLTYQAGVARAERLGPKGFRDFQIARLPPGVKADDPNSWDAFEKVLSNLHMIEAAASPKEDLDGRGRFRPLDYTSIGHDTPENLTGEQLAEYRKGQATATKVLESLEGSTVFDEIRAMVNRPRHMETMDWNAASPAIAAILPELGQARHLARLLSGRMTLARMANDPARFRDALELELGLAHMCMSQPIVMSWLTGQAIDSLGWGRAGRVLTSSPGEAWLDAIEPSAWKMFDERTPISFAIQGDEITTLDTVAWLFEDSSHVWLGRFSPDVRGFMFGGDVDMRNALGTYWQNKAYFQRFNAATIELSTTPIWKRTQTLPDPDASGLLLPTILGTSGFNILRSADQMDTLYAGTVVMIRIERYRVAHGEYPASLASVEAEAPRPLPADPFRGTPLGYKRVDPATDRFGRAYILYSVGKDLTDNNGTDTPQMVLSPAATPPGTDFIINDPRR